MGSEALRLLGIAAAGRHDLALLDECARHRDGLIEQAARIVAQVKDVALELVVAHLSGDVGNRLLQPVGGLLRELRHADIAHVVAFHLRAH